MILFWYVLLSIFFVLILNDIFKSLTFDNNFLIFSVSFVILSVAHFFNRFPRLQAYLRLFLSIPYTILGFYIIFEGIRLLIKLKKFEFGYVFLFSAGFIFLAVSYKYIKRYTNLFEFIIYKFQNHKHVSKHK